MQERFAVFRIRQSTYLVCVVTRPGPSLTSASDILMHCRCIGYSVTESSVGLGWGVTWRGPSPHISPNWQVSAPLVTSRVTWLYPEVTWPRRPWWIAPNAATTPPILKRPHSNGWKAHDELSGKGRGQMSTREEGKRGKPARAIKEVIKPRVAVNLPTPLSCPTRTVMAI